MQRMGNIVAGAFMALVLVGCGGGSGSRSNTDTGSGWSCTCRDPIATVSVTLDGASSVPDRLVLDRGDHGVDPAEVCGPATDACDVATFELPYSGPNCLVEVELGQATMAQSCQDNLTGPEPCVCGQDASLAFAFTSATTSP